MFTPEYIITSNVLNNIAKAEYARAIVENTPILQSWQNQLLKDNEVEAIFAGLQNESINLGYETVKKQIQGLTADNKNIELTNFITSWNLLGELAINQDIQETDIKYLAKTVLEGTTARTKQNSYRSISLAGKTKPEEVLAELTEFIDWLNTREARVEHPIVVAAITKFTLMQIFPFENYNKWISSLISELILKTKGYSYKNWLNLEDSYYKDKNEIESLTTDLAENKDYTQVLEYFSEQIADISLDISEKVKLLAKETKVAKVSGRTRLSERQENILAYLQDYGILQNKDFPVLFPKISEDSVLRDLKALIDAGLIVKTGSTKSSRYELK